MRERSASVPIKTKAWTNARGHWRAHQKQKNDEKTAAYVVWARLGRPIRPRGVLVFTRRSPRPLDCDNLPSAVKYLRDRLVQLMEHKDDSTRCGLRFTYRQEKCRTGEESVRVDLLAAEDSDEQIDNEAKGQTTKKSNGG